MLKRTFDIFISLFVLITASPILFIVSLCILINMGRPIFYIQKRPGLNGLPFKLVKFRTMRNMEDASDILENSTARITKLGAYLRSTSIDELPEFWNVLKGEMSVVGPRPLLLEYLPLYDANQALRHCVRPGITGLAQVSGRNVISWEEKFKQDVWYVKNKTFLLDLRIILLTFLAIVRRDGVNANSDVTMEKFTGSK